MAYLATHSAHTIHSIHLKSYTKTMLHADELVAKYWLQKKSHT